MNGKHYLGRKVSSFEKYNTETPVTGVRLLLDDENGFEAGDMNGNVWEMENPYATQEMADNILAALKGQTYTGFEAKAAMLGLDAELGDGVTVNGLYSMLGYQNLTFGPGNTSDISAPGNDEPEEEYKYVPAKQREEARNLGKTRSIITKTASDIRAEISNEVEGLSASVDLKLDELTVEFDDKLAGQSAEYEAGINGLSARITSVEETAAENLAEYESAMKKVTDGLQAQIDGAIDTWFYDYEPTTTNEPAASWTTDAEKNKHLGDLFYVVNNEEIGGRAYRWALIDNVYQWQLVEDVEVIKALAAAARAQDTADHKRRNFIAQPTPPYDVGDLWSQGSAGGLMICIKARDENELFSASDWDKATGYTDDTTANTAITKTTELRADLDEVSARMEKVETKTNELDSKAIISTVAQFYQSTSATTLSGGEWSSQQPSWTQGRYIWTRQLVTFADGKQIFTPSENGVCITGNTGAAGIPGSNGADGADGADGVGVSSVTPYYYVSTSATATTGGSWSTTFPATVAEGRYLWVKYRVTYDNGDTKDTEPYCMTKAMQDALATTVRDVAELKVTTDKISQSVTRLETSVSETTETVGKLTTQAGEISAIVSQTVNTIKGGVNLINGSDETYIVNPDGTQTNALVVLRINAAPLPANTTYYLSADVTVTRGSAPTVAALLLGQSWSVSCSAVTRFNVVNGHISGQIKTTAEGAYNLALYAGINNQTSGKTVQYTHIKFSLGDIETPWALSPTEVSGELSLKIGRDENNQIVSMLNASADQINIKGDRLVIDTSNFDVSASGVVTAKQFNLSSGTMSNSTASSSKLSSCNLGGSTLNSGNGTAYVDARNEGILSLYSSVYAQLTCGGNAEGYNRGYVQAYPEKIVISAKDVTAIGEFNVQGGAKNRVIDTAHFGSRCIAAYETPLPTFADYGTGQLDDSGVCYITVDPIFLETVYPRCEPTVFLTKYGRGEIWYSPEESSHDMLVIRGTPDLKFAWEGRYAQGNLDLQRLRVLGYDYEDVSGETDFEVNAAVDWEHSPNNIDYAEEAFRYFMDFERSIDN